MAKTETLMQEGKIFLGRSVEPEYLELKLANRHGLVTGATGTGKTVTLQVLAEGFSRRRRAGVRRRHQGRPVRHLRRPASTEGWPRQARQGHRPRRLDQRRLPDRVLGPVRRAGPPHPRHRAGHGAAAARRACWSSTRRRRACSTSCSAWRPTRSMPLLDLKDLRAMANDVGHARQGADDQIRQRRRHLGRRHPAPPAGAGGAGRRQLLRRAGARHQATSCARRRTGAASSTFWPPTS